MAAFLGCNMRILLVIFFVAWVSGTQATCYRISYNNVLADKNSPYYINPDFGTNAIWNGASDSNFGYIGLLNVIGITNTYLQPIGTLIAKSPNTPMFQYGQTGGFNPEQVLYRCDAEDEGELFESYATNSDNYLSGRSLVTEAGVPPHTYMLNSPDIGFRIWNDTTQEYVTRNWRYRALTNLDRDDKNKILVKAKNFSSMSVELIRISSPAITDGPYQPSTSYSSTYSYNQPLGYTTFIGPGVPGCNEALLGTCYTGFHSSWPGNISITNNLMIRRTQLCAFKNVTPHVTFPPITATALRRGEKVKAQFYLDYSCGKGALIGDTTANMNAVGFKINNEARQAAINEGLIVGGGMTGVTKLLSRGYGVDPNIAVGVGIEIESENGDRVNWLTDENTISKGPNYLNGWHPLRGEPTPGGPLDNQYSERFNVYLSANGGAITPSPGKVYATAEVFIRVM
ncbi:fimbrial protein [Shewanella putrefaciens]|uniref:fimbrial protein n=1 Tax=Shewanella putrefaciens TaxID=24 RepID=UPI00243164A5|nr:fimbrial protein [Shewanella putrefaciens]MCA1896876.1 fimbrial protein [Shewanella putrefaciens]